MTLINPFTLKKLISDKLKEQTFLYPFLDSSMTIDESLITSGSILLTYLRSTYDYNNNNRIALTKFTCSPVFVVSIVYQSLVQEDQSLIIFNSIFQALNGLTIDESKQTSLRLISDELTQYKDRYGVFEHKMFFSSNHTSALING